MYTFISGLFLIIESTRFETPRTHSSVGVIVFDTIDESCRIYRSGKYTRESKDTRTTYAGYPRKCLQHLQGKFSLARYARKISATSIALMNISVNIFFSSFYRSGKYTSESKEIALVVKISVKIFFAILVRRGGASFESDTTRESYSANSTKKISVKIFFWNLFLVRRDASFAPGRKFITIGSGKSLFPNLKHRPMLMSAIRQAELEESFFMFGNAIFCICVVFIFLELEKTLEDEEALEESTTIISV